MRLRRAFASRSPGQPATAGKVGRGSQGLLVNQVGLDRSLPLSRSAGGKAQAVVFGHVGAGVKFGYAPMVTAVHDEAKANGKIEASEVSFDSVATIRLLGSLGGLKMEKSNDIVT